MAKLGPKIEMWAIERLRPYEKNAKFHTEGQIEALAKVIKSQGWDVPIVVDKTGSIIKGHGRRLAAMMLGMKEVPVICRFDLSEAQVKAARLSDNRVAIGDYDTDLIREELGALNLEGFDMGSMGFDTKELDMMLKDIDTLDTGAFEEPATSPGEGSDKKGAEGAGKSTKVAEIILSDVLGFKSVPVESERTMVKFLSYAESMSGLKGAAAFAAFCQSVVTELEARS